jgi:hypothetical protein
MSELASLADKLKAARGEPEDWIGRENAVSRFIAALPDTTRVFCRGEVRLDKGHFPAVLTHNSLYSQTLAWAPSGRKGAMEGHHEAAFFSNIPHVGICREVLGETRVLIAASGMEAPSGGETVKQDSTEGDSPVGSEASETPNLLPPKAQSCVSTEPIVE